MKKILLLIIPFFFKSCSILQLKKELLSEQKHRLSKNITVSTGGGGNSGIIELSDLVIIIDTKMAMKSKQFYKSINQKFKNKKVYIINTHVHYDHTDGNYLYDAELIFIPNYDDKLWNKETKIQNNIDKLKYVKISEEKTIEKDGLTIKIIPTGAGHTAEDLVVLIENKKILFAGDLFFNGYHPVLDKNVGANSSSWAKNIEELCEKYDFEIVIPGHGKISDKKTFLKLAKYLEDIVNAKKNQKELKIIKKKYNYLHNIPTISSFNKSIKF